MDTIVIDKQIDYFWELVRAAKLDSFFHEEYSPDKVEIAIIKTPTDVDEEFLKRFPRLKMIIRAGTGYDNIDIKLTDSAGLIVCNTPSANAISASEHTLSLIFAIIKQLQPSKQNILDGLWKDNLSFNLEINELKALIVGLGRIGSKVADALTYFGAEVFGVDPYLTQEEWNQRKAKPVTYQEGLQKANLISYHCPLLPETIDYFSEDTLQLLAQPVILINTARGQVVNEKALQKGLSSGKIIAAGLDVFANEPNPQLSFSHLPNLYITPHTGAYTEAAKRRLAEEVLDVWKGYVFENKVLNRITNS